MKITKEQLRKVIAEELDTPDDLSGDDDYLLQQIVGRWAGAMDTEYDAADPSMEAVGEGAWHEQVEIASREFARKLVQMYDELEKDMTGRLFDGEFYAEHKGHL